MTAKTSEKPKQKNEFSDYAEQRITTAKRLETSGNLDAAKNHRITAARTYVFLKDEEKARQQYLLAAGLCEKSADQAIKEGYPGLAALHMEEAVKLYNEFGSAEKTRECCTRTIELINNSRSFFATERIESLLRMAETN